MHSIHLPLYFRHSRIGMTQVASTSMIKSGRPLLANSKHATSPLMPQVAHAITGSAPLMPPVTHTIDGSWRVQTKMATQQPQCTQSHHSEPHVQNSAQRTPVAAARCDLGMHCHALMLSTMAHPTCAQAEVTRAANQHATASARRDLRARVNLLGAQSHSTN